jgi:hypothetical protein
MATGATRAGSIRAGGGDRERAGADTDTDRTRTDTDTVGPRMGHAMRHVVTVSKFQVPISEIVFNRKYADQE